MKYMNDKITYIDAILSLAPKSACRLKSDGRSFEYFRNKSGIKQPTEAEIDAEVIRLQAEYDAQEYARKRQAEFPSIADVTIALAEKMEGKDQMWDEITAHRLDVKSKYPKP